MGENPSCPAAVDCIRYRESECLSPFKTRDFCSWIGGPKMTHFRSWAVITASVMTSVTLISAEPAYRLDSITVTANEWLIPASKLGIKSEAVDVETSKEAGAQNVNTALNYIPNVNVVDAGRQNSVFLRGLSSSQTKVLLNGMDLKDPIGTNGAPYWDGLNLATLDHIQFVEGSQGALFGTGAVGGILNLITRPHGTEITTTMGDRYYETGLKTGVQSGDFELDAAISRLNDERYSAKKDADIDPYTANNGFARLAWNGQNSHFSTQLLVTDSTAALDPGTPDHQLTSTTIRWGSEYEQTLNPNLDLGIKYQYATLKRFDNDGVGSRYSGLLHDVDVYSRIRVGQDIAILGADYQSDVGESSTPYETVAFQTRKTKGIYTAYLHQFSGMELNVNGRLSSDYNAQWGSVGGIGLVATINNSVQIHGNFSTGFRNPSLYEIAKTYPGKTLTAEESNSKDVGLWVTLWNTRSHINVFESVVINGIDYNFNDFPIEGYENITGATNSKGVEIGIEFNPIGMLGSTHLTYVRTDSISYYGQTARTPEFKVSLSSSLILGDWLIGGQIQSVGQRRDSQYSVQILAPYTVADVSLRYIGDPHWTPFVSLTNVFNSDYEQASGYTVPGRTLLFGTHYRFE